MDLQKDAIGAYVEFARVSAAEPDHTLSKIMSLASGAIDAMNFWADNEGVQISACSPFDHLGAVLTTKKARVRRPYQLQGGARR